MNLDYKKIWTEVITGSLIIVISAVAIISFIVISDQNVDVYNPSKKVEISNGTERIQEVLTLLQSKYMGELDINELTEGAIEGMLSRIDDPYTRYLTEEEFSKEVKTEAEEYSGIGIHMAWSLKENQLRIVAVMPDTPAKLAGIKAGDIIIINASDNTAIKKINITELNVTTVALA